MRRRNKMKIYDELNIISKRLDKIMKPTKEPKNALGDTAADKQRMAMKWITRPKTKPWDDPKFFQKKLPTKEKEKFKYTSWANDRTTPEPVGSGISKTLGVPDKAAKKATDKNATKKGKPMDILKYVNTIRKLYD